MSSDQESLLPFPVCHIKKIINKVLGVLSRMVIVFILYLINVANYINRYLLSMCHSYTFSENFIEMGL